VEDLITKYQLLTPETQQEVQDFLDFLLTKKKRKPFNMKAWKKKIADISVWSEKDIQGFEKNKLASWKPVRW
jgi:hypothetical protein